MKAVHFVIIIFAFIGFSCKETAVKPPNIVLIMGDDIGFSDIGCYGSEIPTPHIDKLAGEGLRFSQFYNMSKCEPSRSVLLTGQYMGNQKTRSIASVLGDRGYVTIQCGKEHFQKWVPKQVYAAHSFDKSFTFWAINEFFKPPNRNFSNPFFLNGRVIPFDSMVYQKKPFYKTDVTFDYALSFLEQSNTKDNPFFLYLPVHAAHYPLQAREDDIALFKGKYRQGWDSVRISRYQNMINEGILNKKYPLSPSEGNINKFRGHPEGDEEIRKLIPLYRPWNTLSEEEKKNLDLEMAVYAAMIYRMDLNIGRIISYLEENNLRQNTVIMYLSDNGSCPYDSNRNFEIPPGGADGYRTLGAAWANAGNTPFRYFKQFGHGGGTNTHFIVSWPEGILNHGSITNQTGHIVDIFPTLLELAGLDPELFQKDNHGLNGTSLLPVFQGFERNEPEILISGFSERFRMIRAGDWKLVRANNEPWELYNLKEDFTELNNLASSYPEKVKEIEFLYETYKSEHALE